MKKLLLLSILFVVAGCSANNSHSEPKTYTTPDYPELKKGADFTVCLRAILTPKGKNEECRIVSSTNFHLNETALKMCNESKEPIEKQTFKSLIGKNRLMCIKFHAAD